MNYFLVAVEGKSALASHLKLLNNNAFGPGTQSCHGYTILSGAQSCHSYTILSGVLLDYREATFLESFSY